MFGSERGMSGSVKNYLRRKACERTANTDHRICAMHASITAFWLAVVEENIKSFKNC